MPQHRAGTGPETAGRHSQEQPNRAPQTGTCAAKTGGTFCVCVEAEFMHPGRRAGRRWRVSPGQQGCEDVRETVQYHETAGQRGRAWPVPRSRARCAPVQPLPRYRTESTALCFSWAQVTSPCCCIQVRYKWPCTWCAFWLSRCLVLQSSAAVAGPVLLSSAVHGRIVAGHGTCLGKYLTVRYWSCIMVSPAQRRRPEWPTRPRLDRATGPLTTEDPGSLQRTKLSPSVGDGRRLGAALMRPRRETNDY